MSDKGPGTIAVLFTEVAQGLWVRFDGLSNRIVSRFKAFCVKHKENLITVGILILVSFLIFGFGWITNGFTLPLSGDGYLQEQTFPYTFYDAWYEFFATGHFPQWNTTSALGSNNLGGNTFYSLLSPLQIMLLFFPRSWIPYLLALRYIFCTAIAGFFFYLYLKSFNLRTEVRRVGAVAYAFCGWVMYYLWFEHFLDSLVIFPFILWGIEMIIQRKDPRMLIIALFVQGVTNYFFLVSFCFGGVFYAVFRYFTCARKMGGAGNAVKILLIGVSSFLVGILMCCFVLIPGIANSVSLPRVESASYLQELISAIKGEDGQTFWDVLDLVFNFDRPLQNAYAPDGFFFMTIRCYSSNLLGVNWYDNSSGSSFIFTPMMILAFSGFLEGFKRRKPSWIIGPILVGFIICCPFFYYLFSGFTLNYARFLLVPSAWIIAFGCIQMENIRTKPRWTLDGGFAMVLIGQAISGVYSYFLVLENPSIYSQVDYWEWRFALVPASLLVTIVFYIIMRHNARKQRTFANTSLILVSIEAIAMGNITLLCHGYGNIDSIVTYDGSYYGREVIANERKMVLALDEWDDGFYRIQNVDASRSNPNLPMIVGYNGLSAFNSVYTVNAQDFLDWSHIPYTYQNWSMGEHGRRINLETFLGVKYYMVATWDQNVPYGYVDVMDLDPEDEPDADSAEALANLQQVIQDQYDSTPSEEVSRSLYLNQDFVELAFPFDTVISSASLYSGDFAELNEYTYLRYGIVDSDELDSLQEALGDDSGITVMDTDEFYAAGQNFRHSDSIDLDLTENSDGSYSGTLSYNYNPRSYEITLYSDDSESGLHLYNDTYGITIDFDSGATRGTFSGLNASGVRATLTQSGSSVQIATNSFYPIAVYNDRLDSTVTVYSAQWDDDTGQYITAYDDDGNPIFDAPSLGYEIYEADEVFDYDSSTVSQRRGLLWWTKFEITPRDGSSFAPDATPEQPTYITIQSAANFDWMFIDEDGEVLPLEGLQSFSEYQTAHGFYVDRPISRIIGVLHDTMEDTETISRPSVYVQSYGDYKLNVDKLNTNPVTISERDSDHVIFSTDYDEKQFVVLNQPYEEGWTLQEITYDPETGDEIYTDVDTYTAQGGFVGFVADTGEREYVLSYTAPGWELGVKISIVGIFVGALYIGCATIIDQNKRIQHSHLVSLAYAEGNPWRKRT